MLVQVRVNVEDAIRNKAVEFTAEQVSVRVLKLTQSTATNCQQARCAVLMFCGVARFRSRSDWARA